MALGHCDVNCCLQPETSSSTPNSSQIVANSNGHPTLRAKGPAGLQKLGLVNTRTYEVRLQECILQPQHTVVPPQAGPPQPGVCRYKFHFTISIISLQILFQISLDLGPTAGSENDSEMGFCSTRNALVYARLYQDPYNSIFEGLQHGRCPGTHAQQHTAVTARGCSLLHRPPYGKRTLLPNSTTPAAAAAAPPPSFLLAVLVWSLLDQLV
jgi:hypothetical protein